MQGIKKAIIEVGLAELTTIQQGLAALRISVDVTVQSIDQQLALQLAAAQKAARTIERHGRRKALEEAMKGNSHEAATP